MLFDIISYLGLPGLALLGLLVGTALCYWKRPNRFIRLLCFGGTAIILSAFLIPSMIGGCVTRGVTSCENPVAQFFASIGDIVGFSLMLILPIVVYFFFFGVSVAEVLRKVIELVRHRE